MKVAMTMHFGPLPNRVSLPEDLLTDAQPPKGASAYIAHPYWQAREELINITKKSGRDRARTEAKRVQALEDYLRLEGMTREEYVALEVRAGEPFYRWRHLLKAEQMNGRDPEEIVISDHQLYGCMANATQLISSKARLARVDQIRIVLQLSPWATGKFKADGTWSRYVTVHSGTGGTLSNQRGHRENEYIENFDATGVLRFNEEMLDPAKVHHFFEYAGRQIGVGASRKMGNGRFEIVKWEMIP